MQKNERFKSVGKVKEGTCLKGKAEISGGALELQKSQECSSVFLEAYLLDIASSCRDDYIISRSEQGHLAPSVVILEHV